MAEFAGIALGLLALVSSIGGYLLARRERQRKEQSEDTTHHAAVIRARSEADSATWARMTTQLDSLAETVKQQGIALARQGEELAELRDLLTRYQDEFGRCRRLRIRLQSFLAPPDPVMMLPQQISGVIFLSSVYHTNYSYRPGAVP